MGTTMNVAFLRGPGIEPSDVKKTEDYSMVSYPHNDDIYNNYHLFSWLADVRDGLVPREDHQHWRSKAWHFFRAFNSTRENETEEANRGTYYTSLDVIEWSLRLGDMTLVMYPLELLLQFNYDQVMMTPTGPVDDGSTYRDQFERDLLKVLEYAKAHHWEYIIFGFD